MADSPTTQPTPTPTPETKSEPSGNNSSPTTTQEQDPKPTETEADDGSAFLADEPDTGDKPKDEPEAVPSEYSDFTLPENYTLADEYKTEVHGLFKDAKLTQTQAQKFVDFFVSQTKDIQERPTQAYKEMRAAWRTETQNHPDLKGKLGAGKEVSVTIAKALNNLGDPQLASDFRKAMDLTGAGDHPAFVRAFYSLARQVTEGGHVAGKGPSPAGNPEGQTPKTLAQSMWPGLPLSQR